MKKIILNLICGIFILTISGCNAQNKDFGSLTGKIYDSKDNEPLVQSSIILLKDSIEIKKQNTDFEGKFLIDSISAGKYNLKILYVGFKPIEIRDLIITEKETSKIELGFNQSLSDLKEVKVEWEGGFVSFIDSTGVFQCVKSSKKK